MTIRWYFERQEIANANGISTMSAGSRSSILSIAAAAYGHSGIYMCEASNRAGKGNYSTELIVNGTYILIHFFFCRVVA